MCALLAAASAPGPVAARAEELAQSLVDRAGQRRLRLTGERQAGVARRLGPLLARVRRALLVGRQAGQLEHACAVAMRSWLGLGLGLGVGLALGLGLGLAPVEAQVVPLGQGQA